MSVDARLESLLTSMLGDMTRLKAENAALMTTITHKERQIAALQEQLHSVEQCSDGAITWIDDELEYILALQNCLRDTTRT